MQHHIASVQVQADIPVQRMRNAEQILAQLGLKPGEAINLFFAQIELCRGLPFEMTIEKSALLSSQQQADAWREAFGEY